MEKKLNLIKTLSFINALLTALSVGGCIYILAADCGLYFTVSAISELVAIVFTVPYYVGGFSKDAAKYYRNFMLIYAVTYLVEILAYVFGYAEVQIDSGVSATVVFSMILYGNTLILAVGKDLGKKASYVLCAANLIVYIIPVIGAFIPGMVSYSNETMKIPNVVLECTWIVLALNAFMMTVAKYNDKALRYLRKSNAARKENEEKAE